MRAHLAGGTHTLHPPEGDKSEGVKMSKSTKNKTNVKMIIFKNMLFLKVSVQTDFRFGFSVTNCIF